jgi:hypothetical protein
VQAADDSEFMRRYQGEAMIKAHDPESPMARDLINLIQKRAKEMNYTRADILAFFTTCLIGTCELAAFSQEFFNESCEFMKRDFAEKREFRKKNESL